MSVIDRRLLESLKAQHGDISSLNLSQNDIREVGDFDVIPTLRRLDLSYNSLTKLQGIESLTALEALNASHNAISDLDPRLTALQSLRSLDLSHNRIIAPEPLLSILQALTSLTELNIKGNQVVLEGDFLENLLLSCPRVVLLDGAQVPPGGAESDTDDAGGDALYDSAAEEEAAAGGTPGIAPLPAPQPVYVSGTESPYVVMDSGSEAGGEVGREAAGAGAAPRGAAAGGRPPRARSSEVPDHPPRHVDKDRDAMSDNLSVSDSPSERSYMEEEGAGGRGSVAAPPAPLLQWASLASGASLIRASFEKVDKAVASPRREAQRLAVDDLATRGGGVVGQVSDRSVQGRPSAPKRRAPRPGPVSPPASQPAPLPQNPAGLASTSPGPGRSSEPSQALASLQQLRSSMETRLMLAQKEREALEENSSLLHERNSQLQHEVDILRARLFDFEMSVREERRRSAADTLSARGLAASLQQQLASGAASVAAPAAALSDYAPPSPMALSIQTLSLGMLQPEAAAVPMPPPEPEPSAADPASPAPPHPPPPPALSEQEPDLSWVTEAPARSAPAAQTAQGPYDESPGGAGSRRASRDVGGLQREADHWKGLASALEDMLRLSLEGRDREREESRELIAARAAAAAATDKAARLEARLEAALQAAESHAARGAELAGRTATLEADLSAARARLDEAGRAAAAAAQRLTDSDAELAAARRRAATAEAEATDLRARLSAAVSDKAGRKSDKDKEHEDERARWRDQEQALRTRAAEAEGRAAGAAARADALAAEAASLRIDVAAARAEAAAAKAGEEQARAAAEGMRAYLEAGPGLVPAAPLEASKGAAESDKAAAEPGYDEEAVRALEARVSALQEITRIQEESLATAVARSSLGAAPSDSLSDSSRAVAEQLSVWRNKLLALLEHVAALEAAQAAHVSDKEREAEGLRAAVRERESRLEVSKQREKDLRAQLDVLSAKLKKAQADLEAESARSQASRADVDTLRSTLSSLLDSLKEGESGIAAQQDRFLRLSGRLQALTRRVEFAEGRVAFATKAARDRVPNRGPVSEAPAPVPAPVPTPSQAQLSSEAAAAAEASETASVSAYRAEVARLQAERASLLRRVVYLEHGSADARRRAGQEASEAVERSGAEAAAARARILDLESSLASLAADRGRAASAAEASAAEVQRLRAALEAARAESDAQISRLQASCDAHQREAAKASVAVRQLERQVLRLREQAISQENARFSALLQKVEARDRAIEALRKERAALVAIVRASSGGSAAAAPRAPLTAVAGPNSPVAVRQGGAPSWGARPTGRQGGLSPVASPPLAPLARGEHGGGPGPSAAARQFSGQDLSGFSVAGYPGVPPSQTPASRAAAQGQAAAASRAVAHLMASSPQSLQASMGVLDTSAYGPGYGGAVLSDLHGHPQGFGSVTLKPGALFAAGADGAADLDGDQDLSARSYSQTQAGDMSADVSGSGPGSAGAAGEGGSLATRIRALEGLCSEILHGGE